MARRGEKVVIRILGKNNLRANIPDLKLPPVGENLLVWLLSHREGIMLVTGPTSSGKTTTLHPALNQLKTGKVNIVTVEDPVEYDVPGISQLQVNREQGAPLFGAEGQLEFFDAVADLVGKPSGTRIGVVSSRQGCGGGEAPGSRHPHWRPPTCRSARPSRRRNRST